ncbi:MAG: ABC transporter permease [Alphaproteobacteria bacterium]|nr:ABC transporter permease [Alphaproteobacteria bacterium]
MAEPRHAPRADAPAARSDFEVAPKDAGVIGDVARPLGTWERIANLTWFRRLVILAALALLWEINARWMNSPLLLPSFGEVMRAWFESLTRGALVDRTLTSIGVLLQGYAAGLFLAAVLTTLAVSTRVGADLLSTLTAMFNPLPAIALLPLALLWFGLGPRSLVFVIIHSVLWAVALNTHTGFMAVSETLRMAGQNYGLRGVRYVMKILIPAAFPSILAGMKIGWAFAWRTLIAAEMVFGVSSRAGGLGWFIYEHRQQMDTAFVFAGLLTVIVIGLLVESVIFRTIETRTVRRWGMQR